MKYGIIGFGNLGRSFASGLVKSGSAGQGELFVCDLSPDARVIAGREPYNAYATDDVNDVISRSDAVFLAVKGYVFEELSKVVDRRAFAGKTVVSFMAGEPFEKIFSLIGEVDLVRVMPSLQISVCDGVLGYTKAPPALVAIFNKLGFAFEVTPDKIENVTAFSSCGLGFAAYLIDAFAAAGESMGFSPETAAHIASLTFKHAAGRGDFRETVKAVTTPGGATEQGVLHMDACNTYDIVAQAVNKAYERMR